MEKDSRLKLQIRPVNYIKKVLRINNNKYYFYKQIKTIKYYRMKIKNKFFNNFKVFYDLYPYFSMKNIFKLRKINKNNQFLA